MGMNNSISMNTQAILLLTAPLIVGRSQRSLEFLTPTEYNRLARKLYENQREPADLLGPEANDLLKTLQSIADSGRLERLLERGFLLSQAIERWQVRSIWVISRADPNYPSRLKEKLKDSAPAVLYGCGDETILETGGLVVVGSREVDEILINYTESVGRMAARAHRTVVSGGARGIDKAAMFGALQAGGRVIGVIADSLERLALARDCREYLMDRKLVLISPYDPAAGFNIGNAMQRNKVIYALGDAALVVNSDFEKGGTWAGATEQLEKLHLVPIYVRSDEDNGKGLKALQKKGALLWPNPEVPEEFIKVFNVKVDTLSDKSLQRELRLITAIEPATKTKAEAIPERVSERPRQTYEITPFPITPAEELFAKAKEIILKMDMPKTETEVADTLLVSKKQAKEWLRRLVNEGVLKNKRKPSGYVLAPARQDNLFKIPAQNYGGAVNVKRTRVKPSQGK